MNNTQKKILMLVLLICGCLVTSFLANLTDDNTEKSQGAMLTEEVQAAHRKTTIRIYVSGAVKKPGLYDVFVDSRADDAINAAGGFTELADLEKVNLARKLKDGVQVNVPTKKLNKASKNTENGKTGSTNKTMAQESTKIKQQNVSVVNINSASAAELEQLPGIGPAMAQRIIHAREQQKFTSVDDLLKIKGIGKAKLNRVREYVKIE
ncbi:MAG: helix-hairpin-helix domain-containing protein [Phascolarctobacterium sp.]|nr:helix-hairpin-helix domain-containing protein [Phascolarctobacterium sp.]